MNHKLAYLFLSLFLLSTTACSSSLSGDETVKNEFFLSPVSNDQVFLAIRANRKDVLSNKNYTSYIPGTVINLDDFKDHFGDLISRGDYNRKQRKHLESCMASDLPVLQDKASNLELPTGWLLIYLLYTNDTSSSFEEWKKNLKWGHVAKPLNADINAPNIGYSPLVQSDNNQPLIMHEEAHTCGTLAQSRSRAQRNDNSTTNDENDNINSHIKNHFSNLEREMEEWNISRDIYALSPSTTCYSHIPYIIDHLANRPRSPRVYYELPSPAPEEPKRRPPIKPVDKDVFIPGSNIEECVNLSCEAINRYGSSVGFYYDVFLYYERLKGILFLQFADINHLPKHLDSYDDCER